MYVKYGGEGSCATAGSVKAGIKGQEYRQTSTGDTAKRPCRKNLASGQRRGTRHPGGTPIYSLTIRPPRGVTLHF